MILRLRNMTALDATGLFALQEVARQLKATGKALILWGTREQPAKLFSIPNWNTSSAPTTSVRTYAKPSVGRMKCLRAWKPKPPSMTNRGLITRHLSSA